MTQREDALTPDDITRCKEIVTRSQQLNFVRMPDGNYCYLVGPSVSTQPSKSKALHTWENVRWLSNDPA